MNYEYLQYWTEAMKDIELLEQLIENNLPMYLRIQDMLYLEYITNNIREIVRLRQLSEEYYNKYYYNLPRIPHTQKMVSEYYNKYYYILP